MQVPRRTETSLPRIVDAILALVVGRNNAVGQVTLTQNAASTTVLKDTISPDCKPQLTPATSAAAAEVASVYVSAVAKGSFTITHPNNATAGRTWNWHATGG